MSGKPITQRAFRLFDTHAEHIFAALAEGVPAGRVAGKYGMGASRSMLYQWRNADPERKRRWEDVRRMSAEAHAERALAVLEALDERASAPLPAEVSLAREKSTYHRWMAQLLDRETFGERAHDGVNVHVSIGQLHLDALKAHGGLPPNLIQAGVAPEVEARALPPGDS